jgi:hypothetical protein
VLTFKKTQFILKSLCAFFGLTLLLNNIRGILYNCFHATDFGIYQQAIYELAQMKSLNPYLSVRNIQIFNDHFDPVIFFAIPFVWIFDYHPASLIIFEYGIFVLFLLIVLKLNQYKGFAIEILFMLLTTKAFLTGLLYPIHPSTWSIIPIFLMGYYYSKNHDRGFILSAFALCFFREVFPLALIFMSFILYTQKKYKLFIGIFFPSVFMAFMIYLFRPMFMGPTVSYGGLILKQLFHQPLATLLQIDLLPFLKISYPFFIPLYFILKTDKKSFLTHPLFFFWLPLIGLHLLTNKVHSQYGPFLMIPIWSLILFHPSLKSFFQNKKALYFTMALFLASSLGNYTKSFKLAYLGKSKKCIISDDKTEKTRELKSALKVISPEKSILATGGIIPTVLKPNMNILQAGLFSKRLSKYDYLLLEKNGSGDTFPYNKTDIEKTINKCEYNIILNNNYYFLAKGPILSPCLQPLWDAWP